SDSELGSNLRRGSGGLPALLRLQLGISAGTAQLPFPDRIRHRCEKPGHPLVPAVWRVRDVLRLERMEVPNGPTPHASGRRKGPRAGGPYRPGLPSVVLPRGLRFDTPPRYHQRIVSGGDGHAAALGPPAGLVPAHIHPQLRPPSLVSPGPCPSPLRSL